jgi:tripartite-type tricarboxylate transporter receptor subunit TctC
VPTAKEVGMPQLEAIVGWSALYGPPKMSPEIINKWVEVLGIADKDANWQAGNVRYGGIPRILSPMDNEKFAVSQYVTYSKLSSQLGIK